MEQVVRWLNLWLGFLFEGLRHIVGTIVSLFDWPAAVLGVPPELFAAGLLCAPRVCRGSTRGDGRTPKLPIEQLERASANSYLGGRTYSLAGGGTLVAR